MSTNGVSKISVIGHGVTLSKDNWELLAMALLDVSYKTGVSIEVSKIKVQNK